MNPAVVDLARPASGGERPVGVPAPRPQPQPVTGELRLRVATRGGHSVAVDQFHRGGLRVLRPHRLDASGQVCYVAINPGGGYLGGDRYRIDLDVEAGASLLLTSQAATKVYRTPTAPARQHLAARVAAGAVLELVPDQLIVYREAEYLQTAAVEVDPDGTFVAAEVVTPGWAPDGSGFGYHRVSLRTEVRRPGVADPFLIDAIALRPATVDVPGLGGLDGRTHCASLLAVDRRVDQPLVDAMWKRVARADALRGGVSLAPGPALVLRVLGDDTAALTDLLLDVHALLRSAWTGQDRLDLRKY